MDRYIYVKSNRSDKFLTDKEVYKFKVHLKVSLPLMEVWKIGLTEFYAPDTTTCRYEWGDIKQMSMRREY
jgi:hypothetical protein